MVRSSVLENQGVVPIQFNEVAKIHPAIGEAGKALVFLPCVDKFCNGDKPYRQYFT